MTDPIPAGTAYVPGSLRITTGANTGPKTDAAADDQGEVGNGEVWVRLGDGATASDGGRLNQGDSTTVRFRVQVLQSAVDTTIANTARLAFRAYTLNRSYTYDTNTVLTPVGSLADVRIAKSGPATVFAGDTVTWTITVTNGGLSAAQDVVVTDVLPADVAVTSITGATCTTGAGVLTCPLGTMANGSQHTIVVSGTLAAGATAATLNNVARVTSATADPDDTNNSAAAVSTVLWNADVSIIKEASPQNPSPGQEVTWTLNVRNAGPSTAKSVVVSDTVPMGMSVVGTPGGVGVTCTVAVRDVRCEAGDLAPDDTRTVVIRTLLDPAWTQTASMTNNGYVQSSTPDLDTSNNRDSDTVTPAAPASDLRIAKRTVTSPVRAGLPVTYQIQVTNMGPSRATGVTVADVLPAALSGATASSDSGTCTVTGQTVGCAVGVLAVGATATVSVTANVSPDALRELTNTATVSSVSLDPNPGNNQASITDPVLTQADLAITKRSSPKPTAGNNVTYTITVTNNGLSTARGVTMIDTLPDSLDFVSATPGSPTCTYDNGQVTCNLGDMQVGDRRVVEVVAFIPERTDIGTNIKNKASVKSTTEDPDFDNNSAENTLLTDAAADLSIDKVAPATVVAGDTITWDLHVTNHGPSEARAVTIVDLIPKQVTVAQGDLPDDCNVTAVVLDDEPRQQVTCIVEVLHASDEPLKFTIRGKLDPDFTGDVVVNTAVVSSSTSDPTTSNNSDNTHTAVQHGADLSLTKDVPSPVVAGEEVTWTLTLMNHGPSDAVGVTVVDALPAGVDYVPGTGDGVTCTGALRAVNCSLDRLAAGQSVKVTVTGRVAAYLAAGTVLSNVATVGSSTPDNNSDNDSGKASATVVARADLSVSKSVMPDPMISGGLSTYQIVVRNAGPSTAHDVVIIDQLPEGLSIVSVQAPGTCFREGLKVTCELGTLAPSSSNTATIDVLVRVDGATSLTNRVDVKSSTPDPDKDNNSALITTDVKSVADVSIVKTAGREQVHVGEGVTYTLTASNAGPSVATDVVITDVIPDGMQLVVMDETCTETAGTISCPVGELAVGATATRSVTLRLPAGSDARSMTNTAGVSTTTTDPNTTNNADDATVVITASADVSVSKVPSPTVVKPGEEFKWMVVVANAGPSAARNTVLTDTVPEPLTVISATMPGGQACTVEGRKVSCTLGQVLPGQTVIEIVTQLPPDFQGDQLTNTAQTSSTSPDPNQDNNQGEGTVVISHRADLGIVKTMSPAAPVAGAPVTFTMTARNAGPSVAKGVVFSDELPAGLINPVAVAGDGGTCEITPLSDEDVDAGTSSSSGVLSCQYDALAVDAAVTVTVTALLDPDFADQLTNSATVGAATPDPKSGNNESSVTGDVRAVADLSVRKTASVGQVRPGAEVTWKLTVRNAGPSTARNVTVSDELPATLEALGAFAPNGDADCSIDGRQVTCQVAALRPGAEVDIAVRTRVAAGAQGTVTNRASVTSPEVEDPDPDNNTDSDQTRPELTPIPTLSQGALALLALLMLAAARWRGKRGTHGR